MQTMTLEGETLHFLTRGQLFNDQYQSVVHITLYDDQWWGFTIILPESEVRGFIEDETRLSEFIQKARFALGLPTYCPSSLTCREIHILQLMKENISNNELAEQLFVSEYTVKSHLYKIYKKIGVRNRIQAIEWARRQFSEVAA